MKAETEAISKPF